MFAPPPVVVAGVDSVIKEFTVSTVVIWAPPAIPVPVTDIFAAKFVVFATVSIVQPVVNDVTNIITCTIVPSVGRALVAGTYVYDVQITNETPNPDVIFTLLTGTITVTNDITGSSA